ncbi:MAG: radical SAM protein, partial [Chloroflexi bacterium]|nr:radical SAM protein [Chloroflexota bacterium]
MNTPEVHSGNRNWLLTLPRPEPSAGIEAYERERALALSTSPRRLANYRLFQRAQRRSAQVDHLPIKLDIENVSRCNFRCTMCQVSEWPEQRRAGDMAFEEFQHLIDEQYGLIEIKLQGMGEPTLGGDDYFRMISYARAQHIGVLTVTNASRLHLRDTYKKLIDAGPNEVQISIDGATKETFEGIRRGSKFEVVIANCRLINDYCREIGVKVTKMWTVVQRDNLHELSGLVDLAHELGFESMVFSL